MQSSSVVRGSIFSLWSLPLMRSVTGTAPSIFDPALVTAESLSSAGLFASAGTYATTKLAATPLPEVKRNLRRVGFGGRGLGSSSDIGPPFVSSPLGILVPRIVFRVHVCKAQRSNRRDLRDVFAGLCPVKVRRVARQYNHRAGWIRLEFVGVEFFARADIEDAGNDCVDPILGMPVRHQLHATRHLDPDHVRSRFRWLTCNDRKTN